MTATLQSPQPRRGDWSQTFLGVQFWPLDPSPDDIRIEDIAHALSNLCRFGGHTREFYSVAQHSVVVSDLLERMRYPRHVVLSGLMHDATEGYLIDLPRPIKTSLPEYKAIEDRLARVICEWFLREYGTALNFDSSMVKWADECALATEARDLLGPRPAPWRVTPDPDARRIVPIGPNQAERLFLQTFERL